MNPKLNDKEESGSALTLSKKYQQTTEMFLCSSST